MKVKLIIISIILLLVMVFACGCIFLEKMSTITSPSLKVDRGDSVDYWAVIVGIEDYEFINDLSYTVDDAEDMRNVLLAYSNWNDSNIQFLADVDASKNGINTAIATMALESDADDVCLFFFSGHGSRISDEGSDEMDYYDEVICPYNTTGQLENVISDDDLGTWLSACDGDVVVILDTCMSGGFTKGTEGTIKTVPNPRVSKDAIARRHFVEGLVEHLKQKPISRDLNQAGYVVLMACEEDKYAYESRRLKNGVFTYYIVEGLRGPADENIDNNVSAEEDFYYADPLVRKYKPTNQYPQLWDDYGGDLALVISSATPYTMHVSNINMILKTRDPWVSAMATVTIIDESSAPVEGVTVSGHWNDAIPGSESGTTNNKGQVSFKSDKIKNPTSGTTFTFTVDDVIKDGWTYDKDNSVTTASKSVPQLKNRKRY